MPISNTMLDEIRKQTAEDPILQDLRLQIQQGWISTKSKSNTSQYNAYKDDLTIVEGIIMKGSQILIPASMRKDIKKKLHSGHQGVTKIKLRARDSVFWPGMSQDIEQLVSTCTSCQEFRNAKKPEPILPHQIPSNPWTKVGTDIFHLHNEHYVIIVDYTSKFFDFSQIPDCQSNTVVSHTKNIFSKYGIPKEVVSDNGPEFAASEYKAFTKEWDFNHTTSSTEFPQSNGQVERTIQTVKKTLKKCKVSGDDIYLALLTLRTTPLQTSSSSPATIMFNRDIRTNLPKLSQTEKLSFPKPAQYDSTKGIYLPPLEKGSEVRIQDGQCWSRQATVHSKAEQPRSYNIQTESGRILRRNRRAIQAAATQPDHKDQVIEEQDNQNDSTMSLAEEDGTITRSGRVSRQPAYLKEYSA